jgi:creatine kinase
MHKLFSKTSAQLTATVAVGAVVYKNFTHSNPSAHAHLAVGSNSSRRFYPASAEYPDCKRNRNIMSRSLTEQVYARLRDLRTPNGFTIDDAIQPGVDNSAHFSSPGCVAGDEETYQLFRELFDKVICEKHGLANLAQSSYAPDTDAAKLRDAELDPEFVLSVRVRTIRNVSGYCLPSFCTRGERRDVESLVAKALYDIDKGYKGVYYSLKELTNEEEEFLAKVSSANFTMGGRGKALYALL